ncbi:MAG: TlpA family protein disulfide reductase [Chloroflexi bacterium]|nr:TlpA family protein disulfide reductase [Chloroflexota bacterium]MYF81197.1 TlpA family protein disulfide reductase [Chloroflexota bacterium]MYI04406.1 TlpA family protein disulfide reductase [Chloroflexota bacterium]
MRTQRWSGRAAARIALLIGISAALFGALVPLAPARGQETSLRVNVAIWVSDQGTAEFCVELHDTTAGSTRQCPDRRRLTLSQAPQGRWLRSNDLSIAPEVSIYARANLSGSQLRYGLGVRVEGIARGLRAHDWVVNLETAEPNRWITSSTIRLSLPVAPHPELWPPVSGMVPGAHRLEVGEPAPDFLLPALGDSDESLVSLSSVREDADQLTLIMFWASWAPFVDETLSVLAELAEREDDVLIIGVNVYETEAGAAEDFVHRTGSNLLHLVDSNGAVAQHYRVDGLPELYVIDSDGIYVGVIRGAAPLAQILNVVGVAE